MHQDFNSVFRLVPVTEERTIEFQERTKAILGVSFPLEYIGRSDSYCLLGQSNEICGGLIVVQDPPFRSLQSIPETERAAATESLGAIDDVAEVNGVWVTPQNKSPYISFSFWTQMIQVLMGVERRQFLFTVDHSNAHMLGHVKVIRPTVVFSGETSRLEGMEDSSSESILAVSRDKLEVVANMLERRGIGRANRTETVLIDRIERRKRSRPWVADFSGLSAKP